MPNPLEKVSIVLGPYDEESRFEMTEGYLIAENHVIFWEQGCLWVRRAYRELQNTHLYIDDRESAGLMFALVEKIEQPDDDQLISIIERLQMMNSLDFLVYELLHRETLHIQQA